MTTIRLPFRLICIVLPLVALLWLATAPRLIAQTVAADARLRTITADIGIDQRLSAQLPLDLTFTDDHGERKQLREYFQDKPVILACVYFRCPMLCTQVLNGLMKSANAMNLELGKDYHIVAVSIDPNDTTEMAAEKKKNYVRNYRREGGEAGWHFLTGDAATIGRLTRAVGFRYRYDAASDQYAHASGITILTPAGVISRYLYGIDYPPRDLRLALVESSSGKIGTAVDQVLLLCFHYDPVTGRYGLIISRVLQLSGILTLLFLGVYLLRMYLLERRRTRLSAPVSTHALLGGP
jgi:protein SCO1